MADEIRKQLKTLDVKRRALEEEAKAIVLELEAPGENGEAPMGVDSDLCDLDGYPRSDVDVYRARALRGRLAVIRTDHKALMQQVEQGLKKLSTMQQEDGKEQDYVEQEMRAAPKPKPKFDKATGKWVVMNWDGTIAGVPHGDERHFNALEEATPADLAATVGSTTIEDSSAMQEESQHTTPFACIDAVAADSPAKEAGLQEGDLVVEFGPINHSNDENLTALGKLVPEAAGNQQSIDVTLLRATTASDKETIKAQLTPRPWSGRGLLGCHIVKYTE